jgi:hypothetical protein
LFPDAVLSFTGTKPTGAVDEGDAQAEPCTTACRRHFDNMQAFTLCRAATCATFAPAAKLSATIAALTAAGQIRRRRPPSPPSRTWLRHPAPRNIPSIALPFLIQQRKT